MWKSDRVVGAHKKEINTEGLPPSWQQADRLVFIHSTAYLSEDSLKYRREFILAHGCLAGQFIEWSLIRLRIVPSRGWLIADYGADEDC